MKRSQSLAQSLNDVKYEQYVNNLHDRLPQLVDPSDIDCQRWPWELVQNAKDTVVKRSNPEDRYVDITIKYYTDNSGNRKLYFEHNGDQFTNKAITGLIWKFSAEKRNEQTTEDGLTRDKQSTGRFGTGFMTTHALSLTVDVSGSLFHDDPEINRNVSVDFTLHREGPDDKAYKDGVDRTEREIDENMDKHPIPSGEIRPTRFTYHLNKESSDKAAKIGIDNVRSNAAQTMLFCPSVRSITVIDEINDTTFKITRRNCDERKDIIKETTFIEEISDVKEPVIRRFISTEIEEYSEAISSHWHAKDRNLRLHVAIEVDEHNNILSIPSSSPAVYCSLPLIGFESMSLPFYINSNDFEPATERTSLYLKNKRFEYRTNEDTEEEEIYYLQSGINWSILERSISLYEKIVDHLIEKNYQRRYNLIYGLNDILKGAWGTETKNCLAARFILPLRNMLVQKKLVNTEKEYRCINSDVKFVDCAKEHNLHNLYETCKAIYGSNLALEKENEKWMQLKWTRFTFESDFNEKVPECENPIFSIIKYEKIADYIESAKCLDNLRLMLSNENRPFLNINVDADSNLNAQKLEWLNNFYLWLKTSDISNLSMKKIVPNRLGVFCSTEAGCDLKDASDISIDIFDFMKRIEINWDNNLLMDGVRHIVLAKESKEHIIAAIKERTKDIRNSSNNFDYKLSKLIPILLALPSNENGKSDTFYKKRMQIVSILNVMFASHMDNQNSIVIDLTAETWEETDRWFMGEVTSTLASRKQLDVVSEDDTKETIKTKYCTAEWLSETLNFMFQKSYLHQEEITTCDNNTTYALIPNRYGVFCHINELSTQGQIPDELLNDELSKTGYDIKEKLLYKGFTLNSKISITDLSISEVATKYNDFFESDKEDRDKRAVASYLIHLIPECGDLFSKLRKLYDEFYRCEDSNTIITTSELNLWKGAKIFLQTLLARDASERSSVINIGEYLNKLEESEIASHKKRCFNLGMEWLNTLNMVINEDNIKREETWKLVPDWNGNLQSSQYVVYDGSILKKYNKIQSLINIIEGDLWNHFDIDSKQKNDNLIGKITHPDYIFTSNYLNNTDEKLFNLVDSLVSFCRENHDSSWKYVLKSSINTLLNFFDDNSANWKLGIDSRWKSYFENTYDSRKELYYDFICDSETKARIAKINDSFTQEEIDYIINDKDTIREIIAKKNYYLGLEEENAHLQEEIRRIKDEQFVKSNLQIADVDTPIGEGDDREVVIVPKIHEIEVEDFEGRTQIVKLDQVQYAGLSLEEIEMYVSEAKAAVVKYYRELNDSNPELGLKFDNEKIARHSYSQLYGIADKYGNEIPLVVHSYKGPQYRYFDLNWYDWQMLSKPGAELWVLTVTGLQCIPLYALPVRHFSFDLENMSHNSRAVLQTLAAVAKKSLDDNNYNCNIIFDFGNVMPTGFVKHCSFDSVPKQLENCVDTIKQVCDANVPQIVHMYNSGKCIPIRSNAIGYSSALKEVENDVTMAELFEAKAKENFPPIIGTTHID